MRSIPALTGIRFIAAVYVFLFHYGATAIENAGAPKSLSIFFHNGFFGVSIFFILSGFILAHAHRERFDGPTKYKNYLIARFARVYPVYLFVLLIAIPVAVGKINLKSTTAVLFMVQSWANAYCKLGEDWIMQAWTLSVELVFYLLFPFFVDRFRRLNNTTLVFLMGLMIAFIVYGGVPTISPETDRGIPVDSPSWLLHLPVPLPRAAEFIFGILVQIQVSRWAEVRVKIGAAWLVAATAGLLLMLSTTTDGRILGFADILVGILIALICVSNNTFTRVLGCRTLWILGSASYALYLLEEPIRGYLGMVLPGNSGRLLALPITIAMALLVWRFVEEPARRLILRARDHATRPRNELPVTAG